MTRIALALLVGMVRQIPAYGRRKLDQAVERLRMRRVRRNPAALATAVKSARSILIVCHGNIIRSPFAARLVAQALNGRHAVAISSGGLETVEGRPPHPSAASTASRLGVDLSSHASAPAAPESVANADVIFVMDIPQLVVMRSRFPHARRKTFLLTCLAPEAPLEILDPIDGDDSVFQACYEHISQAVRPIVGLLAADGAAPMREGQRLVAAD
jgi:protein-tyrosine-phosphatase